MSKRVHKAIFERELPPFERFGTAKSSWEEVAREWVNLAPQPVATQRAEFVDAAQTKVTQKTVADCVWSPTMSRVDASCRMKIAKANVVDESKPNDDCNFRIFHIENIVNVREANRELQFAVVERI